MVVERRLGGGLPWTWGLGSCVSQSRQDKEDCGGTPLARPLSQGNEDVAWGTGGREELDDGKGGGWMVVERRGVRAFHLGLFTKNPPILRPKQALQVR